MQRPRATMKRLFASLQRPGGTAETSFSGTETVSVGLPGVAMWQAGAVVALTGLEHGIPGGVDQWAGGL